MTTHTALAQLTRIACMPRTTGMGSQSNILEGLPLTVEQMAREVLRDDETRWERARRKAIAQARAAQDKAITAALQAPAPVLTANATRAGRFISDVFLDEVASAPDMLTTAIRSEMVRARAEAVVDGLYRSGLVTAAQGREMVADAIHTQAHIDKRNSVSARAAAYAQRDRDARAGEVARRDAMFAADYAASRADLTVRHRIAGMRANAVIEDEDYCARMCEQIDKAHKARKAKGKSK